MEALLSVIITVYNVQLYLEQCICSVLNQYYNNIEIILVDDGSEDESGMICDQFAAKNSKIKVIHKKNEGVIKARYDGVKNSSGHYITFVDGDDWVDIDMYKRLMERLQEKNAEMITSGITRYYSEVEKKIVTDNIEAGYYDDLQIKKKIFPKMIWNYDLNSFGIDPSLCTKIFVKEKIEQSIEQLVEKGYSFHYGEDIAILYPYILNIKSMIIVETQFYFHRQRNRDLLPSYLTDNEYFEKLFKLYQYLRDKVSVVSYELEKQIDYFYMYSINIRKRCYNDIAEKTKYIFPFDKVEKGSKVILYGAGVVGSTYYHQIKKVNYCEVVLWVDKNYYTYRKMGHEVMCISDIFNKCYDYIILCNTSNNVYNQIREELIGMGVIATKII